MHGHLPPQAPHPLQKTSNKAQKQQPGGLGRCRHWHTSDQSTSEKSVSSAKNLKHGDSRVQAAAPALCTGAARMHHARMCPMLLCPSNRSHLAGQL